MDAMLGYGVRYPCAIKIFLKAPHPLVEKIVCHIPIHLTDHYLCHVTFLKTYRLHQKYFVTKYTLPIAIMVCALSCFKSSQYLCFL